MVIKNNSGAIQRSMKLKNNSDELIAWLLEGDISIQYQVYRDLLNKEKKKLQKQIATQGWGLQFLSKRNPDGYWGQRFYQPK